MIKELRQLIALYARWRPNREHALLLPIQTLVTARHLLPLAKLAAARSIPVRFALAPSVRRPEVRERIREMFAPFAEEVGSIRAHAKRWSLVVVADHGHFHSLLPSGCPVVHIGHGSPSKLGGRRRPNLPWEYGHAPRRRNGQLRYREMIESSEPLRLALQQSDPVAAGRIRVLGRLIDDEMMRAALDRDRIRKELRIATGKPVLMVASSIGSRSLFSCHWDPLCEQLEAMVDRYQVVLCPHPNEDARWRARHRPGSRVRLLEPEFCAERVVAASDLLLCDYTSLCHKAALLDVPMVFAECEPMPVWPQGATAQLYGIWPRWNGRESVAVRLDEAEALRGCVGGRICKDWVNSEPGRASELYAEWLGGYFPKSLPESPRKTATAAS